MNAIRHYMNLVEAMSVKVPSILYHVTPLEKEASILKNGISPNTGSWRKHRWRNRIFLTTTLNGANEMAMMFADEHRGGKDFTIIKIDSTRIPNAKFFPDKESEFGVWTASPIPPEAVVGTEDVDLESEEFQKFMGVDDEDEE